MYAVRIYDSDHLLYSPCHATDTLVFSPPWNADVATVKCQLKTHGGLACVFLLVCIGCTSIVRLQIEINYFLARIV